jgi:N-acyl-D-aspartate/D-glutamate deacylase
MAHDLVIRGGLIAFDPNTIACPRGRTVNDMPDGGPRSIARASGTRWTFVNGRPIIRDGRLPGPHAVSGAGRVLRAA